MDLCPQQTVKLTLRSLYFGVAVVLLAFVLAIGFTLVILSCALWNNWLPLIVGESILPASACTSTCRRT